MKMWNKSIYIYMYSHTHTYVCIYTHTYIHRFIINISISHICVHICIFFKGFIISNYCQNWKRNGWISISNINFHRNASFCWPLNLSNSKHFLMRIHIIKKTVFIIDWVQVKMALNISIQHFTGVRLQRS